MKTWLFLAAGSVVLASGILQGRQQIVRTVYVSAVDKAGVPVTGLTAADFSVTEDGRARQVTGIGPGAPLRLAIVIYDRGMALAEMRAGLGALIGALPADADAALFSLNRPEWTVSNFTRDKAALAGAIETLLPMMSPSSDADLHSLVIQLAHEFGRQHAAHPVIAVFTIDRPCGPSCTPTPATSNGAFLTNRQFSAARPYEVVQPGDPATWERDVRELQRSGVTFFAVADRHRSASDHDPLIDIAPEHTGGQLDQVVADGGVPAAFARLGRELASPIPLTFASAAPDANGFRLRVQTTKPDVTIRAPERVY